MRRFVPEVGDKITTLNEPGNHAHTLTHAHTHTLRMFMFMCVCGLLLLFAYLFVFAVNKGIYRIISKCVIELLVSVLYFPHAVSKTCVP